MEQPNRLLRMARIKKSWTVEFVSHKVGVSPNTYTRWEAGRQVPRHASLRALCSVFEMTPEELGFSGTLQARKSQARIEKQQGYKLEAIRQKLEHCSATIATSWQTYQEGGQADLERVLPGYLLQLGEITLYPGPEQQRAATLTAQLYQLLALLQLQHGDFVSAQAHGTQALVYSQIARDWNLYIASQIHLATIFTTRKRIGSALVAYNDALRLINITRDAISPLLHSRIFAGLAEIQAAMGREKEAMQFLQLAVTVFPETPEMDPGYPFTRCDRTILFLYQGLVLLRLGKPRLAWKAFEQIDGIQPAPAPRVRAEFLRHRAYTSIMLGNMIQSCIYLEAAARAAQHINSELAFSECYTLYEHMLALWGKETRVRLLAHLFQH
ncbi:DNA-binding XRE family transcriptional regulator [Thermosporothrix hazakensis]|jgi:tetratricopeptide (TPR) repeat protein|uniref:DNA-binding XRE family transcriptional regulator n=2 Tax=Thermosporothrix TaxID=768650 RepID=A0A326TZK8_THEHA|nr:helix-turn-helix transcriptional regulator [Thermosporothrix hazakensis]PZW22918.1 DNA-binding XRE family transcriptional regulator [Thermosporothrix hazakensis]BBH89804.1 hypothetical protein KTC_45550 [Thermosporothrix sp. COM3]GCE47993.1 hypothetical protein KTH_28620 [Thermosporothrix hazakensis]